MLLVSELRENWLPLLVFLLCINWLCNRNGMIEKVESWYFARNRDDQRIVLPTIATLVLPFACSRLSQELSVFFQSTTSDVVKFSIPTVATLATFLWRQEDENRKAASSREEKKDSAFYLMHSELIRNQNLLARNRDELRNGDENFQDNYLISPRLDPYRTEDLEYALRNFPHTLSDANLLITVENVRVKAYEANLAINKRNQFLERQSETKFSKAVVGIQLGSFSSVIYAANSCLEEDFASLKRGIRHLVYKS